MALRLRERVSAVGLAVEGLLDRRRLGRAHPGLALDAAGLAAARSHLSAAYRLYVREVSSADMAASLQTAGVLLWLCRRLGARRALDLGSGFSSYVLRGWVAESGAPGQVLSVDDSAEWLERTGRFLASQAQAVTGLLDWERFRREASRLEPFDVVFHDLAGGPLREEAMPIAFACVRRPSGVILLDDAHHGGHRQAMRRLARANGFALFNLRRVTLDRSRRFAMLAVPQDVRPPTP
jgi:predicted O-methyltransferase YrrM